MTLISDSGIEVARWSLRLLGGFELAALPEGESISSLGKRERVLLAYLALSPNCRAPRRKLANLLWGDATDEAATDNLRVCVFNLRKALGEEGSRVIASEGRDLALDPAAFEVDALQFRRLAAEGGRTELKTAARLYSGEFLDGLEIKNDEYESWRREEAARFRDQIIDVLARLMVQLAQAGETEAAIEAGMRLLRLDPLHEAAVRLLMRLYGESGRRGAAVQLYRSFADTLKKELNAQPEAETQAVLATISRGSETHHTPIDVAPVAKAPDPKPEPTRPVAAPTVAATMPLPRTNPHTLRWLGVGTLAAAALVLLLLSALWDRPVTLVVLPFANLSGDKGQEYFSDGMTEEITAALAKVPGWRVVARTSAFQFKDKNLNIRDILGQLHARYAVQGSVRRDRDRLRVTAQLVDTSGTTLWSENYDRQFADVIPTQEDIARAVATALRVPLGLKPGQNLLNNRAIGAEDYQLFLRARALEQTGGRANMLESVRLLEQVVARNPNYAPAHASLAGSSYRLMATDPARFSASTDEFRRLVESNMPKIEAGYRRAIELDPTYPGGYEGLNILEFNRGKVLSAEEWRAKAMALSDPNDPSLLDGYSVELMIQGRIKEANALRRQLQAVEPFVPLFNRFTALYLWVEGNNDAALAILNAMPPNAQGHFNDLARIYASMGRYDEAADFIERAPGNTPEIRKEAARLMRLARSNPPVMSSLDNLGGFDWVYLYTGSPERAIQTIEADLAVHRVAFFNLPLIWHASYAPVRKTERFKAYLRAQGLVDYWRAKGWPEFCHPVGADDFACE